MPNNVIAQALRGLRYPLEGVRFIHRNGLWGAAMSSIVVNIILLLVLIVVSIKVVAPYVEALHAWAVGWAGGIDIRVVQAIVEGAAVVLVVAAWALVFVLNAIVLLLVGQAVASPFLDMLSEKVEELVLGTRPEPFTVGRMLAGVAVAMADLVWGLLYLVGIHVPIFVIGLVPVVGSGVAPLLSFVASAWLLSHEFVGLSLARHLVSYRARWRAMMRSKWLTLGFGAASMVLLLVPGLNLLLLPLATVGGTLLYCDLAAAGRLQTTR